MIAFEVGGHKYQAGTLDVFDQLIVAKRLMPVMKNIVTPEIMGAALKQRETGRVKSGKGMLDGDKLLPAMADALYAISDEDIKILVRTTLAVVSRQNQGGAWSPVLAPSGDMMFKDINLSQTLQIAWKVIEGHLGDFFGTAR